MDHQVASHHGHRHPHPAGKHPHAAEGNLRLVAWEVTRSCNLACIHCRAAAQDRPYENETHDGPVLPGAGRYCLVRQTYRDPHRGRTPPASGHLRHRRLRQRQRLPDDHGGQRDPAYPGDRGQDDPNGNPTHQHQHRRRDGGIPRRLPAGQGGLRRGAAGHGRRQGSRPRLPGEYDHHAAEPPRAARHPGTGGFPGSGRPSHLPARSHGAGEGTGRPGDHRPAIRGDAPTGSTNGGTTCPCS